MGSKRKILGRLAGVGLFLSVLSGSIVQAAQNLSSMTYHPAAAPMGSFRYIEQPITVKVSVAVAGLALIGLELWWFRWRKRN